MSYTDDAKALFEALEALVQAVPGFERTEMGALRKLVRHAGVPDECIITTVTAIEASPLFAAATPLRREAAYDAIQFALAYETLATDLEVAARGVRYAIAKKRAGIGAQVLDALAVARRLVKQDPTLQARVANMRRTLAKKQRRFVRRRRKKG